MGLKEDQIEFRKACSRCKGKCCYGETGKEVIPLTISEAEYIESHYPSVELKIMKSSKDSEIIFFYVPKCGCPLLKDKKCLLSEEHKPLNCKIFPIVPEEKDGKLILYWDQSGLCPEYKNLEKLEYWKNETIKQIKEDWKKLNKKEKKFMSELTQVTKKTNKLIAI